MCDKNVRVLKQIAYLFLKQIVRAVFVFGTQKYIYPGYDSNALLSPKGLLGGFGKRKKVRSPTLSRHSSIKL